MSSAIPLLTKATVLVVDDTPINLSLMRDLLQSEYQVKVAPTGARALKIARATPPDLILLDIMMPDMDGYEVCRQLKADELTASIPIIFLTAKNNTEDEQIGFDLGVVDYITKPISPPIIMARVRSHLVLKVAADILRNQKQMLEIEVAKRTHELESLQDVTILIMASLAETRDNETGNHILRTQRYVRVLAETLRLHPRFSAFLTPENIELLFKSAPLHDIGKVGIPDKILLKPGRFEPHEMEIMKTHTTLGRVSIEVAEQRLGRTFPFLQFAKEIAYSHQEKWDGSGYPEGLIGDAIPISARLMAVADVYDALVCKRVYKDGMTHESAAAIMIEGRGSHFDPDILDAFVSKQAEFREIAERYSDAVAPSVTNS
ncbi:response regulator [Undibacterium sp. Ji67W]|uniref:response regulator n=1 Tax=Undibacterium sp. Ji67W TaxID=3413042 RepID=UPI003BF16CF9